MKKNKLGASKYSERMALQDIQQVFSEFKSSIQGYSSTTASRLLKHFGKNKIFHEKKHDTWLRLIKILFNPLVILLLALSFVSLFTQDIITASIIGVMVFIAVTIRFYQETRAYNAAQALQSLVKTTCTVMRDGQWKEIDLDKIVPGDVVRLSAGDIIPADARIITSKDLFINQSLLTGESLPVEKHADVSIVPNQNFLTFPNLCFMGTNVVSGIAHVIIIATGNATYLGSLAKNVVGQHSRTSFEQGLYRFTWLMIGFMAVIVPIVFLINGLGKHHWWEAFLFSISVAVGLTPELLPALVTVNLCHGALAMAKKKVIVKNLNAIQNLGAMNVLCSDKTGTLTQNKVALIDYMDINGEKYPCILSYAYINSYYQTGFKNLLDDAILKYGLENNLKQAHESYKTIDELPFDFQRRRLSIIVADTKNNNQHVLICKGAIGEVLACCTHYQVQNQCHVLQDKIIDKIHTLNKKLSQDGFRAIAIAYKTLNHQCDRYSLEDESELTFLGLMTFFDPPRESASMAIQKLIQSGVAIKILTGDNELVTQKICRDVGLRDDAMLLGNEIDKMNEQELQKKVNSVTIFARLSPDNKKNIVQALRKNGHVVGFLGDGINDAPAMRVCDVGISVDTAVDIAKESADIVLLEAGLLVLQEGVIEGRKIFANIMKYIKMGASSNFGNVLSVLGASVLLPFLPMLPLQLLINNLLYDISQLAIPTDKVDEEYIQQPREWKIKDLGKFMLCMGPVSSIFDYVLFGVMWFMFGASQNPALFHTGWFIESLLTQTLIVHVIRSRKIPFIQTRASNTLLFSTMLVMIIGVSLIFMPFASTLGFVILPWKYWPILIIILLCYIISAQKIKTLYIKKYGYV